MVLRSPGIAAAVLLSLLSGCAGPQKEWTPGPIITEYATPSGSPASPTQAPPPGPGVPDALGAIDVSGYADGAHFASPSGRIWCALRADSALCHFPAGMDTSSVPAPDVACPGADLDVTGVWVEADSAEWFCSGGAEALPQTSGDYVGWWKPTGYPAVRYSGQRLATLPYGKKLVNGSLVCLSEKAGVTCGNTATSSGFKVSRAGVTFLG